VRQWVVTSRMQAAGGMVATRLASRLRALRGPRRCVRGDGKGRRPGRVNRALELS
jgi:hypothetical protein